MSAARDIGIEAFVKVNGTSPAAPANVYRQASLDVVFGELWGRPGLDFRQRRLLCLAAAGICGAPVAMTAHVYGSLSSGDISPEEMGEFLLHFACYAGLPRATVVDAACKAALDRIAAEGGHVTAAEGFTGLRDLPLHDLVPAGREVRSRVLGSSAATGREGTPVADLLVAGFEYGQTWSRGLLSRTDRRLVTLTCLAVLGQPALLAQHIAAACESGDLEVAQLREVALHLGFYAGVPVAILVDATIDEVVTAREI